MQSSSPTKEATSLPFTPKKAPDATELLVDARHPRSDEKLTKMLPIKVPATIALTDCHQPRPYKIESQPKTMTDRERLLPTKMDRKLDGFPVRSLDGTVSTP